MQPEENYLRKYYTEEAWARRSQILEEIPPEAREREGEAWRTALFEGRVRSQSGSGQ